MSKLTKSPQHLNRRFFGLILGFLFCFVFISGYSQIPLNTSKPVGMTAGEAGSNGAGAAVYTIPIDIPAGVKGIQPGVSITYSSQGGGNGYSGHGWSLSALSMITRAGKNVFHNGISTPVDYTGANDAFVMDGQRLMLINGTYGAAGSVYGTEQESFSKIEAMGGNGDSPDWFKVTTKNGTILEYGADNSKLKTNDGINVIFWMLRKVTDASGNYMLYNYDIDNANRYFTLKDIAYAANSNTGTQPSYKVMFTYSAKTDYQSSPLYLSGSSVYSARILDRIDIKKADETQIRSYVLSYQYRQKKYFLSSVTEAGADGTTLNPLSFTYGENTTAADVTLSSEHGPATDRNYTGDFDGDGRTDVQTYAYRLYPSGNIWYKWYQIYDFDGTNIVYKYQYDMEALIPDANVKVLGKDAVQNPFSVSDFDGDGKEDVLLAKFDKNNNRFKGVNINYSRVKQGFGGVKYTDYKKMAYDNLPGSWYGQHTLWKEGGSFFASGDFDGDGHLDYILILGVPGTTDRYKAFFSTPSLQISNLEIVGFGTGVNGASGDFSANVIAEAKSIIPINFDGDGKTELLVVRNEGSYVLSIFPMPVSPPLLPTYGSAVLSFTTDIKTDYKIFPGDFNGDGNTDLFVRPSKDNAYTEWKIFLSTGKAFTKSTFLWAYTIILPGDGFSNSHMISIGDFDGDGKSDIWHSLDITTSSSNHVVYYSNGTSFTHEINGLSQSTNSQLMYSGGDFNGDGKPDLMKVRKISDSNFPVKFLMSKPFKEQNLLVGASNLGYLTSIDYALLNGKDNSYPPVYSRTEGDYSYYDTYDPSPHIPEKIVPAPAMYVLANIMRPDGIGYQDSERFNYQDLILHTKGRGFLGFKLTESTNFMYVTNRSWMDLDLEHSMLIPDVTQVYLKAGGMFTRSRYTTSFQQVSVSSSTNRRFFTKTDRVHTKNWLTNEAEETLNIYDDYGNVTQTTVNKGTSNDFNITNTLETATNLTSYDIYAGAPYPGFPTSTTVQNTRTGKPQVSKTTNYTYTAQGLPETVTANAGTAIATTVTNIYNGFGLPTQVTTSAPGVTTPVINYSYDPKGLFVEEKKITGGGIASKETATYDDRWQAPLSQTTTDGLTTTYEYDHFGVLKQTNLPDGNSVISTKNWETSGNARFSVITQRTDGSSPVKVYIDILGRKIKTEKRGYNNQWLTSTKTYDSYGQLEVESAPYYAGETINNTAYFYDSYGRPFSTTNNTGTVTTTYTTTGGTSYTVKTSNDADQWTSKTSDASGKVISSSDNGVEMNFTYDSWGNQLTAGSNGQTFVTNVFDNYGRKQNTTDVNAGTITYQYNSIGQLIQQTDAKNQIQTTSYDVFGRVSATGGQQGTTNYTYYYDAGSQKSNNNVTQIIGFGGDVRTYQYDNLQRLSSESLSMPGINLSKTYTYDAYSNLATTAYPAGFLIRNVYDNNDILTQTKYEQGATVKNLFTASAMNSRGLYTNYSTGNGKTKGVTYDFTKETITRYYTAGIQDLNLVYESNTMNLLNRNDVIKSLTETFTYDTYDRLTSAKINGVQQFAMSYDAGAQGKILQKTDIGNYNYDGQKIHQLKYLTPISGGTDPTIIIGTNERNITYSPFLKTETITENGYNITYTYGSDQQRLKSTLKLNGATIEAKTYWGNMEVFTKNGVSSEIYYLAGGNGLNNIIVKQNGTTSIYYTYTDQLGSILSVTNETGTLVAEQNFDAWGRYRNPANWNYTAIPSNPDWLYRGFTAHEHLPQFALINMNGRMYDPMTGMMMSPDNYTPMPWSPGGYNRYNYAYGNPLKFIDPDGEFIWFIIGGAILGSYIGASMHQKSFNPGNWGNDWWKGAITGAIVGAGAGALVASAMPATAGGIFANGSTAAGGITKAWGITTSVLNSANLNIGMNALSGGGWDGAWKAGIVGATTGFWAGTGGIGLAKNGLFNSKLAGKLAYQSIGTTIKSIGNNWSRGQNPLSKVSVGVGPVNLTFGKGQRLIQWQNNIGNITMNAFGLSNMAFGGNAEFSWRNLTPIYRGGIIDKIYPPSGGWASGFSPYVVSGNSNVNDLLGHELHHVWQSRALGDMFLPNYIFQGVIGMTLNGFRMDDQNGYNAFISPLLNYFESIPDYYPWW